MSTFNFEFAFYRDAKGVILAGLLEAIVSLDLTGYGSTGLSRCFLGDPESDGLKSLAARILFEKLTYHENRELASESFHQKTNGC